MTKPAGTGSPSRVISARLAPLPPNRWLWSRPPSAKGTTNGASGAAVRGRRTKVGVGALRHCHATTLDCGRGKGAGPKVPGWLAAPHASVALAMRGRQSTQGPGRGSAGARGRHRDHFRARGPGDEGVEFHSHRCALGRVPRSAVGERGIPEPGSGGPGRLAKNSVRRGRPMPVRVGKSRRASGGPPSERVVIGPAAKSPRSHGM